MNTVLKYVCVYLYSPVNAKSVVGANSKSISFGAIVHEHNTEVGHGTNMPTMCIQNRTKICISVAIQGG